MLTTTQFAEGFGGGVNNSVSVEAEALDALGNDYITGNFTGKVSFGATTLTSAGDRNIFVAKLNPAGGVVWARNMGSTSPNLDSFGRALALDSNGNLFVTGFYSGTSTFGGITLNNAGGRDSFVEKLDNSGNVLWAKGFGGVGDDLGQSLAVDGSGNVVVTGSYQDSVTFGGTTLTAPDGSSTEGFVTKLNSSGSVQWAVSLGGAGQNSGYGIATDTSNNIYVTGNFTGSGGFGAFILTSAGDSDLFVAKLSSAGVVDWALRQGGAGHDDGTAINVDPLGDVYVTGDFIGSSTFGAKTLNSVGQDDAFVEKLDVSGNVIWANRFGGTGFDAGFGIMSDSQGVVYTTGVFQGTAAFGGSTLTSAGGYDVYAAKIAPSGVVLATYDFGSTRDDQAYQIALGTPNSTFTVVGSYGAAFNVNNDGLFATGSGFVIQISQATPAAGSEPLSDFDSLGHSQLAVFQPSTAQWFALGTSGGHLLGSFGSKTDIPAAGDYDHVGHSQLAVFRPSTAQWFALGGSGGHLLGTFGAKTDFPVPGDYDHVGHTELAVFRPSTAQWFALGGSGGHLLGTFGAKTDIPSPGDFDGLGHTELAVYRPSTAQWFVLGATGGKLYATFGAPGDIPVPGDYDGVGHDEPAVFRPSTGEWFVLGPNGGHLMNVFGATNFAHIPTESNEAANTAIAKSGGRAFDFATASAGSLIPPSPFAFSGSATSRISPKAPEAIVVASPSVLLGQPTSTAKTDPWSLSIEHLFG